jgi:probable F420-dependent oxidoreductase
MTLLNTDRSLRVGALLHQQHTTYQSFVEAVRRVEGMGVDAIFVSDHFFPLYGDPQGDHLEGWTLLSAMATLTERAEIGCMVTCSGYRNPALLSNMAKTVDHISQGRLILGMGAGMLERDYQEYGYEFGTPGSRLDTLEKALQIIQQRWEVDNPKPTRKIPILIGGNGEKKTLRLVAQYANSWHGHGDPEAFKHKVAVLHDWCARVERDPAEIECAISPFGPANMDVLDAYAEAGATHVIVGMGRPAAQVPWNFEKLATVLKWRDSRRG